MRTILSFLLVFLGVFWLSSCSDTPSPNPLCTPGATQKCVCLKAEGVQACKDDGSGWKACDCGSTSKDLGLGAVGIIQSKQCGKTSKMHNKIL